MKRTRRPILLVLSLLLSLSTWISIRHRTAAAQNSKAVPCCGSEGERELDFPYYSLANGFSSTLRLVSDSAKPLGFTLVIHGRSGLTQVFAPMTIQPGAKLAIDLRSLLISLNADVTGDFAEGNIAAFFTGTIMPLVG